MSGIGGHVNRGDRRRRREQPHPPTESERMAWFSRGILRGVRDALPGVRRALLTHAMLRDHRAAAAISWRGRGA